MPYTPYNSSTVRVGPGTIYAAPLGTAEPTSATGTWGTGWVKLGYTTAGSTFTRSVTTATVDVEEEIYSLRTVTTAATGDLTFNLAEDTATNLLLALNAGIGTSLLTTSYTTEADGSIKIEPPPPGNENRVMIGWDAVSSGGAPTDKGSRLIIRQAYQTGNLSKGNVKGNTISSLACTFTMEKPPSAQPFAFFYGASNAGLLTP